MVLVQVCAALRAVVVLQLLHSCSTGPPCPSVLWSNRTLQIIYKLDMSCRRVRVESVILLVQQGIETQQHAGWKGCTTASGDAACSCALASSQASLHDRMAWLGPTWGHANGAKGLHTRMYKGHTWLASQSSQSSHSWSGSRQPTRVCRRPCWLTQPPQVPPSCPVAGAAAGLPAAAAPAPPLPAGTPGHIPLRWGQRC